MCCNNTLETVINDSFLELQRSRPDFSSCNIDQIAKRTQENAERMFGTTFEVVSGVGDYASKSHFYADLICKIEADGKFVLAYATPRPDVEDLDGNGASNEGDRNGNGDRNGAPYVDRNGNGDRNGAPYVDRNGNGDRNGASNEGDLNGDQNKELGGVQASGYKSGNTENALGDNEGVQAPGYKSGNTENALGENGDTSTSSPPYRKHYAWIR